MQYPKIRNDGTITRDGREENRQHTHRMIDAVYQVKDDKATIYDARSGQAVHGLPNNGWSRAIGYPMGANETLAYALETAQLNPDMTITARLQSENVDVPMECYVELPIPASATLDELKQDYLAREETTTAAFLQTTEGKRWTAAREKNAEKWARSTTRRAITKTHRKSIAPHFVKDSSYQFPDDFPSITQTYFSNDGKIDHGFEDDVRTQIVIGAQWLQDHPEKDPVQDESARREIEEYIGGFETYEHSGSTRSLVIRALAHISEHGFNDYIHQVEQDAIVKGVGTYTPPAPDMRSL